VDSSVPAPVPTAIADAVAELTADLSSAPFRAPDADRLRELGLGPRELAAAERAGVLERLGDGVVLLPGTRPRAAQVLAKLPQPFTVSQAREALGTTRRVVVPLLERMDREGLTIRRPDDRRTTDPPPPPG
jgi:selenocysteine-specific elongation factor